MAKSEFEDISRLQKININF